MRNIRNGTDSTIKWCFKKGNLEERRLVLLSISLGLLVALFNLCFCFWEYKIANLISVVPFAGWIVFYYVSERKRALKVKTNPKSRLPNTIPMMSDSEKII